MRSLRVAALAAILYASQGPGQMLTSPAVIYARVGRCRREVYNAAGARLSWEWQP